MVDYFPSMYEALGSTLLKINSSNEYKYLEKIPGDSDPRGLECALQSKLRQLD
jgi:hypothetical protein